MVLTDGGLTELAEQVAPLITQGQWGIGTATPAVTDIALGSAIADTLLSLSATSSGNSVQFTHSVPSTAGNGTEMTEFALIFSDSTLLNRTLGGAISKTSSFEVDTIVTLSFIRG